MSIEDYNLLRWYYAADGWGGGEHPKSAPSQAPLTAQPLAGRGTLCACTSAAAFASGGRGTFSLTMLGHTSTSSFILLNTGAGVSALTSITESGSSTTPLVYLNAGATLAIGRRLRIDAEVSPVFTALFQPDADPPVAVLPVVRLRYVL